MCPPKVDENEDSEVVECIDRHITCALPDKTKYSEMSNFVKKVQTHHGTATCRTKKDVVCRCSAHWVLSDKTRIVCSKENIDETIVKQGNKNDASTFLYCCSK